MKTPRLLLLAAWAFVPLASHAQTGDRKPIIIDLGDNRSLETNFGPGEQDGRSWIALIPKQGDVLDLRTLKLDVRQPADNTRVARPIILDRSYLQTPEEPPKFMVARFNLTLSRAGTVDVLEYVTTPPPGLMSGEVLRVKDRTSSNQPYFVLDNGPVTVWDPSAAPVIANGQGNRLLINPATMSGDDTGYWRRKTTVPADNNSLPWLQPNNGRTLTVTNGSSLGTDRLDPRNWFSLPGSDSRANGFDPFGFNRNQQPVTIYPKMSGYKYDPSRHMLISPEGLETEVIEGQVPGRFVLGPAIITPGTKLNGITLVNANDGKVVKPETPVKEKPKTVARTEVKTYGDWKDRATKLTLWRDVDSFGPPSVRYHCFHPGLVDGATLKATIAASRARNDKDKNTLIPCVTWSAGPGDRAEEGEGDGTNKFKYRKIEKTVALDLDQEKLVVIGQGGTVIEAREAAFDLGAFSGANMVMVVDQIPALLDVPWKDVVTPLAQWRRLELKDASKTQLFCFIGVLPKTGGTLYEAIEKSAVPGLPSCMQWKAPAPDDVQTHATSGKFKTREISGIVTVNIDKKTKKLKLATGDVEAAEAAFDAAAFAPANSVKAASKPAEAAAAAGLSARELKWLTRAQAAAYTKAGIFTQAGAAEYRQMIAKNLMPDPASKTYGDLARLAATSGKQLEDALPGKTWGEGLTDVVAESGPNKDLQLTPDQLKTLRSDPKYAKALEDYIGGRALSNGNVGVKTPTFDAANYDPIQLHLTTEAALSALPPPPPPEETPVEPLTEDQINTLLSAKEAKDYRAIVKSATDSKGVVNKKDGPLQTRLRELKPLIDGTASQPARKPYAAPGSLEAFGSMPDWQKDKFCDAVTNGRQAAAADSAKLGFDLNSTDLTDVQKGKKVEFEKQQEAVKSENAAVSSSWAKGACAQFAGDSGGGSGGGTTGGDTGKKEKVSMVPPTPGADKEVSEKKDINYFGKDLMLGALKGALLGLLIGSLLGPVGLIMGPIIGAALFYGAAVDDKRKPSDS